MSRFLLSRRWYISAVILALMHLIAWIANAPSNSRIGNLQPLILLDFPLSVVLLGLGWNSQHLFLWFGILGTIWWFLLALLVGIVWKWFVSLRTVPNRKRRLVWLSIGALWIFAWILALVPVFLFKDGSRLAFREAEVFESLFSLALSFPSGFLVYWTPISEYFARVGNAETDLGPLICAWLLKFAVGTLQWFVFVPWVTRRVIDTYRRLSGTLA